jgi:hypothetical protein
LQGNGIRQLGCQYLFICGEKSGDLGLLTAHIVDDFLPGRAEEADLGACFADT